MLEFQEKRRIKNILYSRITLAVLFILIIVALNAVSGVYKKQALTKDNLAKTAASAEGLRAREKMLSSEIERLKTEAGKEEEIRAKYGLVKPGEEVLVVVDGDEGLESDSARTSVGFWQKIKGWFK